jgi:hypothetical protein
MAAFSPLVSTDTETACGTSVDEAKEALAFWRGRLNRLPWHRRAARAEAREMAARWQQRLVAAQLERWRLSALTGVVVPAVAWWGVSRATRTRRVAALAVPIVRRTPIGRMVMAAAAAIIVAALTMTVLLAVLIAHFA